jgi:acyl-CoA thioesterase
MEIKIQEDHPFLHVLGVRLVSMGQGKSELALTLTQEHMNSWGATHGGVIMSLLDAAMSAAGRSLDETAEGVATVELKTSFLRASHVLQPELIIRGMVLHSATTLFFGEAEVWCLDKLIAKGSGTFKYLRRANLRRVRGNR